MILHPIPPLFSEKSRILILGSFPSVKSREAAFFYGHPQNRFWKMLAGVYGAPVPGTVEEKKALVLSHGLALWDVLAACEIVGSADSSIREAKPQDLSVILSHAPIEKILVNGKTAEAYFLKYQRPVYGFSPILMPSTSPANAAVSLDMLIERWGKELLS